MKILIVDDEHEIADLIELYLKNENYQIFKAYHSEDALDIIKKEQIDLALFDVMMPKIDGFELCKIVREEYQFPIIMVTAKVTALDKIEGLTIGADDYITKPFTPLELVARVKAQLRRYKNYNKIDNNESIIHKGLNIQNHTHQCFYNEQELTLTPTEFSIIWELSLKIGMVVTTSDLFQAVWKSNYQPNDNNTIMVHIRHIREKMKDNNFIKTIWGVGYTIEK